MCHIFYNFVGHYIRQELKEKVETLIGLRRVREYIKKLIKVTTFFLSVYLPGLGHILQDVLLYLKVHRREPGGDDGVQPPSQQHS